MYIPYDTEATPQSLPLGGAGAMRVTILRNARAWMSGLLAVSDLAALAWAGLLAYAIRGLFGGLDGALYLRFWILPPVFVLVYWLRGLYPAIGLGAVEEFRRLTITTSFVFVTIAAFSFIDQTPPVYSRLVFALAWMLALALVPLGRAITRAVFARLRLWGEPVAVVGPQEKAWEVARALGRNPKIGLLPALVCSQGGCPAIQGRDALRLPDQGRSEKCRQCPASLARVSLVIYSNYDELGALRDKYRDTYERVIMINQVDYGRRLKSASVCEFGGLTGLELHQNLLDRWAQWEKRVIDRVVAGAGLVLLSPLFAMVAALIFVDDPGRIFYRQLRVGKGGRYFKLYKFRTMHLNADEVLRQYLAKDPALQAEWDQYQKLKNDPRITRVGRVLRRFSIDELPQLWNVFKGDMSLVGPRPIMINQIELYGRPYEHYVRVTPGITGLWQISGRNQTTFAYRAEMDVYYVMSWSIWMDIYILARTIWVVFRHQGAA